MSKTAAETQGPPCRGCAASVRVPQREVARILAAYLREHPQELADEATCAARLAACATCPDLVYGTTCRHCGCLVAVRARLKNAHCPDPRARAW